MEMLVAMRSQELNPSSEHLNYAHIWRLIGIIDRNLRNPLNPILNCV